MFAQELWLILLQGTMGRSKMGSNKLKNDKESQKCSKKKRNSKDKTRHQEKQRALKSRERDESSLLPDPEATTRDQFLCSTLNNRR